MKSKYLRKNIKNTKNVLKDLARDYRVRLIWEVDTKRPRIIVEFHKKIKDWKFVKIIILPEDKIAYGKYKPSMVAYNVARQLTKWLSEIYEEYCS